MVIVEGRVVALLVVGGLCVTAVVELVKWDGNVVEGRGVVEGVLGGAVGVLGLAGVVEGVWIN